MKNQNKIYVKREREISNGKQSLFPIETTQETIT